MESHHNVLILILQWNFFWCITNCNTKLTEHKNRCQELLIIASCFGGALSIHFFLPWGIQER